MENRVIMIQYRDKPICVVKWPTKPCFMLDEVLDWYAEYGRLERQYLTMIVYDMMEAEI